MKKFIRKPWALLLVLLLGGIAYAGLETVTHIQDLNSAWPLGSDLASTSDDHIRNIKSALKTDFPNFNGTYTSASLPVFAIPSDTNTGMYSVAADDLGFTTGGTRRFDISTTALTGTLPFLGQDGLVGTPGLSFSADPDTGLYRSATNELSFTTAGVLAGTFRSNGQFVLVDGSNANPALAFLSDTDTGIYRRAANSLTLSAGGNDIAEAQAGFFYMRGTTQLGANDGAANAPGLTFTADADTGFYRDTNNQIGIALAGVTAGQFISGSFTGTLTGMTAGTTGTVFYRCVMSICTLSTGTTLQILGTSNTTAMTMTGVPAAAQSTSGVCGNTIVVDNGASLSGKWCITAGTITFSVQSGTATYNTSGFTNSGSKGLSNWSITYSTL